MANYGCFVHLRDQTNFNGSEVEIRGNQDVATLDSLSGKWNRRANSFTTGDSTWAELYRETNFKGSVLRVGPNTAISALKDFSVDGAGFGGAAQSIKVYDARPAAWRNGMVLATDRRRGSTLSDLRRASVNRKVRDLAVSLVGEIPTAGSYLSPIVSFLWPAGPSKSQILESMHSWASNLVHDVLENVTVQINENRMSTLARFLTQYVKGPSEANFHALYNLVLQMESDFTHLIDPADNISSLTAYGTIAVAVYRAAYFRYDDIYKTTKVPGDKEQKLENLKSGIASLRGAVYGAYEAARMQRLQQVTWDQPKTGSSSGTYRTRDLYTNYEREFKYGKSGEKPGAEEKARSTAEHIVRYSASLTFAAEFDIYLEVADMWTYFDQAPKTGFVPPTAHVTSWMGMWGREMFPPAQYGAWTNPYRPFGDGLEGADKITGFEKRWDVVVQAPPGGRLNRIVVHGDQRVEGLEVEIDGKPRPVLGKAGKHKLDVKLASNQEVTGVFGAWGDMIEHVSFRVQDNDAKGEPSDYPTEPGIGSSPGGNPFSASGPDGGRGTLTGFFGQTVNGDYLQGFGTLWSYDRVKPRT